MFKAIHGLTATDTIHNNEMAGVALDWDTRLSNPYDVDILPNNLNVPKRPFIYNRSVIFENLFDEIRMVTDVIHFKFR